MVCDACKQQQATGRVLGQDENRKGESEGEMVPLRARRCSEKERETSERSER